MRFLCQLAARNELDRGGEQGLERDKMKMARLKRGGLFV